ncbi:hypothetical protein AVEN_240079-1 [Araneus ventricosus]|uniref:Uncharacterized protein n=1 Tax=Araneus ventricosus TaxID=182803 RepID=A0A4Y2KR09_ARAVE|nr:hypothetical protein AVEN_240079-1 [Araneus ventricosus]
MVVRIALAIRCNANLYTDENIAKGCTCPPKCNAGLDHVFGSQSHTDDSNHPPLRVNKASGRHTPQNNMTIMDPKKT